MPKRTNVSTILNGVVCMGLICSSPILWAQTPEVTFSGRVLDQSDKPIAGAEITFTAPSRHLWNRFPPLLSLERLETPDQVSTADSEGKYRQRLVE